MLFYSTNHQSSPVSLREAVINGLAPDNGLYIPERIPELPKSFFRNIESRTFQDIAFEIAEAFIENEVPENKLKEIIETAITFDAPLVPLKDNNYVLELFHGPTLAFKDFGARFMAGLMSYFVEQSDKELNVLVATSGDTGSAVASGFYKAAGIRVFILYPSGKVSDTQEKQLTTWGENITAIEVQGTFDDCQRMVKQAFTDKEITNKLALTSANSINIARLIPQTFYYFHAYAQLIDKTLPVVFSVPSGNFGNLTGGLIAARMGLPVSRFIASTNINDVVPKYLSNGTFNPRPSHSTISNAMDVGNPSNFARMKELFTDITKMRNAVAGYSLTDEATKQAIRKIYTTNQYLMDPHGAVAWLGLQEYRKNHLERCNGIFLETAHPAKFADVVKSSIDNEVVIPENLKRLMNKQKVSEIISNNYEELKEYLLRNHQ